jgi:tetratricopeptide (TPR) repeat protein
MTAAEKQDLEVHAMARLGEYAQAKSAAEDRAKRSPDNGDIIELENTMAEIDLGEDRPADAIAALQPVAVLYDLQDFETPAQLGRAYLAIGAWQQAATEFRRILANRGVDPNSPLYPLAYLGLARALHMEHRDGDSRATYRQLFAFWKSADADLPILMEAKAEYSRL